MKNILILGAGFGGVCAALKLEKRFKDSGEIKITLIDRNNFHLFTPSLYEVAAVYGFIGDEFGQYLRGSVAIPYAEILKGKKINFIQTEIKEINLREKYAVTGGGARAVFDYLIIALGGETEFYDVPGAQEYSFNFKTVEDAFSIYKKLSELKKGEVGELKIAIIGGGFTGVELAAELSCCAKKVIKECSLDERCVVVQLFEAGRSILKMVDERQRKVIEERLKNLGVQIHQNSPVREIGPNYIKVGESERENFNLIIWAGGVRGPKVLENIGLKLHKNGTLEVNNFLQVLDEKNEVSQNVFAIGDCINFIDPKTQRPVPATAYVAHALAEVAAGNITRCIKNEELKSYQPFYDVWSVPTGGKWAYTHFKNINVKGFTGYLLRQAIDFRYFLRVLPPSKALKLFFKDLVLFAKND